MVDLQLDALQNFIDLSVRAIVSSENQNLKGQLDFKFQAIEDKVDLVSKSFQMLLPIMEETHKIIQKLDQSQWKSQNENLASPITLSCGPHSNGCRSITCGNNTILPPKPGNSFDCDSSHSSDVLCTPENVQLNLIQRPDLQRFSISIDPDTGPASEAEDCSPLCPGKRSSFPSPSPGVIRESVRRGSIRRSSTKEELSTIARVISQMKHNKRALHRQARAAVVAPYTNEAENLGTGRLRFALVSRQLLRLVFGISAPDVGMGHVGSRIIHPASPFVAGVQHFSVPERFGHTRRSMIQDTGGTAQYFSTLQTLVANSLTLFAFCSRGAVFTGTNSGENSGWPPRRPRRPTAPLFLI